MSRFATFPAALIAAALAGAPIAYAANGGGTMPNSQTLSTTKTLATPSQANAVPAAENGAMKEGEKAPNHYLAFSDRVSKSDMIAFAGSAIGLDQAISTAESGLRGKAVEAVFKAAPDRPHYVGWVMRGNRVYASWIDGQTGKMTWHGNGVALSRLYPVERSEFLTTASARSSLRDAVIFAAKDSGNKPIAATFERIGGSGGYYVSVLNGGTVQLVGVSASNPPILAFK